MLATYIMKSLFPLTILTFFLPCHLPADVSKEIQLGVEAVAGYRSGYVYRGFELAESTIDFQVETEIALSNRTWQFNDDFSTTAGVYYDFGAEAWYGNAETQWSKAISEKTFLALNTGISYVDDYYGRDGINDAYGRLSLTHHLSDTVSITPYLGGSLLLDSSDAGDDQAFAGLWFEVRF